jgi:pimeloyl-ACP methyl ester carboxylesterase
VTLRRPSITAIAIPVWFSAGLLFAAPAVAQSSASGDSVPRRTPPAGFAECTREGVRGLAWCGHVRVPEDRETRRGRMIDLEVVILPAAARAPLPDPVVWLEGGPGESAIKDVDWWQGSPLRAERDLVFVDLRGTGTSRPPLHCDRFHTGGGRARAADGGPERLRRLLGPDMFPLASVKRCREALERTADLRLYHNAIMMDDLDDVRAALGYDRLNLIGGSGGTRAALVYLRRHPEHVRTMLLAGVVATYHKMPLYFARDAQRALNGVARECAADSTCHRHFPDVLGDVRRAMGRAEAGASAEVRDPASGAVTKVPVPPGLVAEMIRNMLYGSAGSSLLPLYMHAAAQGNFQPIVERALGSRSHADAGRGDGVYFSVTCAEDLPWVDRAAGTRAAAGTFLGTARLRQQLDACAAWPRGRVPADFAEPVRSDVPTLLVSGALDPVTPPGQGAEVARDLRNSLHIVVPSEGHQTPLPTGEGDDGSALVGAECVERIEVEFVRRGSVAGLDTSCVRAIRRKGFKTSLEVSAARE